jgi:hypothetical protein
MGEKLKSTLRKPWFWLAVVIALMSIVVVVVIFNQEGIPAGCQLRFIHPAYDINGNADFEGQNHILRVYYETSRQSDNTECVTYNIIFTDEDRPEGDKAYDAVRRLRYGRLADIETIIACCDKKTEHITTVEFPTTYSREQRFFTKNIVHYSQYTYLVDNTIYINTWNHMFAEYDTNQELDKYSWTLEDSVYRSENGLKADLVEGSREDAEVWVRDYEAQN